jgi:hypothetical protein
VKETVGSCKAMFIIHVAELASGRSKSMLLKIEERSAI